MSGRNERENGNFKYEIVSSDQVPGKITAASHYEIISSDELLGNSYAIRQIRREIEIYGPTDGNILIIGESGTGKEIVAHNLHKYSKRKNNPLLGMNCSCIPAEMAESELFGHEKGAYTGAVSATSGLFGDADGGTIFLDEIGHMPRLIQPKLLRAVELGDLRNLAEKTSNMLMSV